MAELMFASLAADNAAPFYRGLGAYLAAALGRSVRLLDEYPWQERERMLMRCEAHVGVVCGLQYVLAQHDLKLLAAPVMRGQRYGQRPVYFSDVVVRSDSAVRSFEDLRGARFAVNEPTSHSGYGIVRHARAGPLVLRLDCGNGRPRAVAAADPRRRSGCRGDRQHRPGDRSASLAHASLTVAYGGDAGPEPHPAAGCVSPAADRGARRVRGGAPAPAHRARRRGGAGGGGCCSVYSCLRRRLRADSSDGAASGGGAVRSGRGGGAGRLNGERDGLVLAERRGLQQLQERLDDLGVPLRARPLFEASVRLRDG